MEDGRIVTIRVRDTQRLAERRARDEDHRAPVMDQTLWYRLNAVSSAWPYDRFFAFQNRTLGIAASDTFLRAVHKRAAGAVNVLGVGLDSGVGQCRSKERRDGSAEYDGDGRWPKNAARLEDQMTPS